MFSEEEYDTLFELVAKAVAGVGPDGTYDEVADNFKGAALRRRQLETLQEFAEMFTD